MSGFINHTSFSSFFIVAIKVYNIQRKAMGFRAIPHNCPLLAFRKISIATFSQSALPRPTPKNTVPISAFAAHQE